MDTIIEKLAALARAERDPAVAAHRWAVVLDGANPFDATSALAQAALSEDPAIRRVVAETLVWDFEVVGADLVLDHLALDPYPAVRFAVARAAHARRAAHLLLRLGADPDERVADAAAFALATRS